MLPRCSFPTLTGLGSHPAWFSGSSPLSRHPLNPPAPFLRLTHYYSPRKLSWAAASLDKTTSPGLCFLPHPKPPIPTSLFVAIPPYTCLATISPLSLSNRLALPLHSSASSSAMAPANGATSKPGQGMSRRPAGGSHKPVVPVIPLAYLQPQRRNPSAAIITQSPSNELPVRNEPASDHDLTEAQPNRAGSKLDETGKTTVKHHHTTSQTALPQNQARPSQPEAVTPSATAANTATVNDRLATPPSAPSSKKEPVRLRCRPP